MSVRAGKDKTVGKQGKEEREREKRKMSRLTQPPPQITHNQS